MLFADKTYYGPPIRIETSGAWTSDRLHRVWLSMARGSDGVAGMSERGIAEVTGQTRYAVRLGLADARLQEQLQRAEPFVPNLQPLMGCRAWYREPALEGNRCHVCGSRIESDTYCAVCDRVSARNEHKLKAQRDSAVIGADRSEVNWKAADQAEGAMATRDPKKVDPPAWPAARKAALANQGAST